MLLALGVIALFGCGGDSGSSTDARMLSQVEESIVTRSQATLQAYCRKVGLYLTRRQPLPTPAETGQVNDQLDALLALAYRKPAAQFRNRGTLRQVLGDMTEDLQGANCSGALERKLEQGFATLPPD